MELSTAFGLALKQLRKQKGLTQEDFSNVSSRTYLSTLERGIKGPTIEKLEQLAGVLDVHPATILVAAYLQKESGAGRRELLRRIDAELKRLEDTDH
ncbi:TPA: helix-turn-helix transcriptional regulator [Pseudomonas aeruginosa]|uniref:helix-turn-helix domain-containing protein n=1 Tax=Pseudomonas TaxID=286 RepID=UPI000CD46D19|nr:MULTISPECIES: helix-turn-helix transcriptional regulator [Pseudomonas]MBH9519085.1 helix-turn-helix transcriptional regulator [Pseudomonas aeruginosa]MBI8577242.1 helix-turn-helix transcriptional regulator [Pseudomonas aeruginosa]MBI8804383.1 helix-turn-helix transcriptional regulator [Pseudomonas aeruginosa]MCU9208636.1 helix-turn-helix domain-containing protein [Pseudomonas aeruginosa]MDA3374357.1 helix-turn-helix transcriptional regulator [Pseudomonas aeruginosa]